MLVKIENKTPEMGALYIVYDGASNIETTGTRGLSHLWEHCKCHSYDALNEDLLAAGIISNAYTSDRNVVYHWTGLDEKIEEFQERLLKLIDYIPTREEYENEKKIVMQEYEDCFSNQHSIFYNIMRKHFNYFGPIGYREDIINSTYEQFIEWSNTVFAKPYKVIRVGSLLNTAIDNLSKNIQYGDLLKKIDFEETTPDDSFVESPSTFGKSLMIADWMTIQSDELSIQDTSIISALLGSGLSSPFYQEIREKRGLVYYCRSDMEVIDGMTNLWYFYAGCTKETADEVRKTMKEVITNHREYVTPLRYKNVIESLRNKIKLSNITNHGRNFISKFITPDSELEIEYINSLTYEEVQLKLDFFAKHLEFIHTADSGESLRI
jgi:predicted Zn-dependent peptidase